MLSNAGSATGQTADAVPLVWMLGLPVWCGGRIEVQECRPGRMYGPENHRLSRGRASAPRQKTVAQRDSHYKADGSHHSDPQEVASSHSANEHAQ
jgi:hypothetical protein